jgi:hypothetical protein
VRAWQLEEWSTGAADVDAVTGDIAADELTNSAATSTAISSIPKIFVEIFIPALAEVARPLTIP